MSKRRGSRSKHRSQTITNPSPKRSTNDTLPPKKGKLARARLRHFFFTVAPDRLMRGLLKRRHLLCPIHLREITLHVPSWPERWEGVRIAHLSDIHLGDLMPIEKALELVDRVAKAKPDMLACTGDVVDLDWHGAEPLLEAMGSVPASLGRFLVLGNHDLLDDPAALSRAARRRGLRVLHGAVEHVRRPDAGDGAGDGGSMRVGGIEWGRTKRELAKHVDALPERPDLLLAHNPKAFPAAARIGVPLTLAGHTHGGQMALPDRTVLARRTRGAEVVPVDAAGDSSAFGAAGAGAHAARTAVGASFDVSSLDAARVPAQGSAPALARTRALRRGLYAQGDSRLFVSVGAGSWFPARVNCPAETLILTVRR